MKHLLEPGMGPVTIFIYFVNLFFKFIQPKLKKVSNFVKNIVLFLCLLKLFEAAPPLGENCLIKDPGCASPRHSQQEHESLVVNVNQIRDRTKTSSVPAACRGPQEYKLVF